MKKLFVDMYRDGISVKLIDDENQIIYSSRSQQIFGDLKKQLDSLISNFLSREIDEICVISTGVGALAFDYIRLHPKVENIKVTKYKEDAIFWF